VQHWNENVLSVSGVSIWLSTSVESERLALSTVIGCRGFRPVIWSPVFAINRLVDSVKVSDGTLKVPNGLAPVRKDSVPVKKPAPMQTFVRRFVKRASHKDFPGFPSIARGR